jgi:hypothetical protein
LNETLLTKLADSSGYPPEAALAGTGVPDRGIHWNQRAVIRINPGQKPGPATPLS